MSRTRTTYEIERDNLARASANYAAVCARLERARLTFVANDLRAVEALPRQIGIAGANSTHVTAEVARLDAGLQAAKSMAASELEAQRQKSFDDAFHLAQTAAAQRVIRPQLEHRGFTRRERAKSPLGTSDLQEALKNAAPIVERVLSRVPDTTTATSLSAVGEVSSLIGQATTAGDVNRTVLALRVAVDGAIADAAVVTDRQRRIDEWIERLYFLSSTQAEELGGRVRRLIPESPWPEALEIEIEDAISDAERLDAGERALDATRRALEALGYAISGDFVEESFGREGSFAAMPERPNHRLRVRERRGELLLNVIRVDGDPDPDTDLAVEESFCELLPSIQQVAAFGGVRFAMQSDSADGILELRDIGTRSQKDSHDKAANQARKRKRETGGEHERRR